MCTIDLHFVTEYLVTIIIVIHVGRGGVGQIGCYFSQRIWTTAASTSSSSAGDFDQRQTEAQGGFEGESHCWTDPIRLEQDKQLGVDALCPRLL